MNVSDPFTRSYRSKRVATARVGEEIYRVASERKVRGYWRHDFDELNLGPRRLTIAGTFCALPTFHRSAVAAIAAATSNETGLGTTGSTRALPQARAA